MLLADAKELLKKLSYAKQLQSSTARIRSVAEKIGNSEETRQLNLSSTKPLQGSAETLETSTETPKSSMRTQLANGEILELRRTNLDLHRATLELRVNYKKLQKVFWIKYFGKNILNDWYFLFRKFWYLFQKS